MSKGLTGIVKHSNGLLTTYKLNNEKRIKKLRTPLHGYPKEIIFNTPEQIYEYLSHDRLICLLCGRTYKMLATHLTVHGFTADSYREKYGLPYTKGLVGTITKKIKSDEMKKRLLDGTIKIELKDREYYREMAHKAAKNQKFQPYRKCIAIRNVNKEIAKRTNTPINLIHDAIWQDEHYYKVLDIMKNELRAPRDVLSDKNINIPRYNIFMKKVRKDEKFRNEYFEVLENLPTEVLAKHQILGKKIRDDIILLKNNGFSHTYIANKCNVSLQTINNLVKELGIKTIKKTHCKRGHEYIKGKCKVCATIKARELRGHFPREIAKITVVIKNCTNCGKETKTNRLGMSRPIIYCKDCKRLFYLESQKKYKEANWEKRKEMARKAYQKRKKIKD